MLQGSQGREENMKNSKWGTGKGQEEKRRAGYAETWRADKKYHP